MSDHLPENNADGLPVVPMTEEQKYVFDLRGWLLLPGLLSEEEVEPVREHIYRLQREKEFIPPEERYVLGGPGEFLQDHPVIAGIMNEIISHKPMETESCYGFRVDGAFSMIRGKREGEFSPHGGGGLHRFCGNSHLYQHQKGQVHSGLTRVVWELNEVKHNRGGTLLLSGSHKAAFERPESISTRYSDIFDTYGCPAGSVLIFTEALCHSGNNWELEEHERAAIFVTYNTVGCKWHSGGPSPAVVDAMKPLRQTLFRGVWTGAGTGSHVNHFYDEKNRVVNAS